MLFLACEQLQYNALALLHVSTIMDTSETGKKLLFI